MRAAGVLLLLAVASACAEPETGRSDTLRWFTWPDEPELDQETVEGVEESYGLEFIRSGDPNGAVTVYFDESPPGDSILLGSSTTLSCTPHVLLRAAGVQVVAHEIGHAYGLGHVDDVDNLMFPSTGGGDSLTDEQLDKVRESAWRLEETCRSDASQQS